jgi:Legionella pneumophila major outer membrane protein precursor
MKQSPDDSHGQKDFSMRNRTLLLASALAFCIPSLTLQAQTEPSNRAVLLPPQTFDDSVKAPNTTRERFGQWSISGGAYLVQPVFSTNPAFVVNSAGGNVSRQVDFSRRLDAAPDVWIGYVSERGWGVRGHWFDFDHGTAASYAAAPGETITGMSALGLGRAPVNGTIAASSSLAVNVLDIQGTCSFEDAKWSHLLGIGVRYTHMSQDYRATLTNANTRIDLTSGHNLNGAGPSFALETKRRIGESGFAIYGQLNGAILFGHANEAYTAVNNGVLQQFTRGHTDVLPVGELEVGAEYQRNVGRAKLFLQAGFVGQVWWGGGNASNLDPLGPSSASNSNFGFLGLALRGGVRY